MNPVRPPATTSSVRTRHVVRLAGVVIGYSDLEDAWPDQGRARGVFRPGIGYELVEPVFRLYAEAVPTAGGDVRDEAKLERYHGSRDALGLALEDADGTVVRTSAIHVADYTHDGHDGDRFLDVLISDDGYWERRAAREGA
ncbi:MAG: hypothetical protein ACRENQ_06360 [Gemmatimonadaceae bacterium]